jgi:citrate synthase
MARVKHVPVRRIGPPSPPTPPAIAYGLKGVVVTETRLSHVDGERGELIIGGFPLDALAPYATFEDVLFLLWHDRLPTAEECSALRDELAAQRTLPDATLAVLRAAAERSLPAMDALRMGVATLTLADPEPTDESRTANLRRAAGLVGRFPTVVAAYARLRHGLSPIPPHPTLGHAENYLYMLTGEVPLPAVARALETYLNTVVDHGMNASTFAARVIVSTRSDMVSALVGAIGALKGPLHGGAPGPALDMVFAIQGRAAASGRSVADEAEVYVREALAAGERIMGFGHRVYKVRDPRADVLGRAAAQLFEGADDTTLYNTVRNVEGVVVRTLAELKPGRRLETNVEFYTALLLHGIGLATDLFTPTFAIARAGGWTAHVLEQLEEDHLIRPESRYVGPRDRTWQAA